MNKEQEVLVNLVGASIKGQKYIINNKIGWDELYNEAKAHKVKALAYSGIAKQSLVGVDKELLDKWKKRIIKEILAQKNHIAKTWEMLKVLDENQVKTIILKGLVIKDYYPNPDTRTMGDADVLVKEEDLEKVKSIFEDQGYKQETSTSSEAHLIFYKGGHPLFEVHWTLADERFFKGNVESFERNIWKGVVIVDEEYENIYKLGLEDFAFHLCLHMAVHAASSGFGIRLLADFVLLLEKEGANINWNKYSKLINESGIEKFNLILFNVCERLFSIKVPKDLENYKVLKSEYIDMFIDILLSGGLYGKRDLANSFSSQIAYDKDGKDEGVLVRYLKILFPAPDELSDKYWYAKKYKVLLPIGWIHHLIAGIFIKEYSIKEKISFILKGSYLSYNRNKVLKWLEL